MIDGINAKGSFNIKIYENGRLVEDYTDSNLVVSLGKTNVAKLLGGDLNGVAITKVQAGTNGTPPSPADAAITNPFTKAIATVTYPASNEVQFGFTLEAHEANGKAISEFGLVDDNNILFARKTRTVINKVSPMVIVGAWKITIN